MSSEADPTSNPEENPLGTATFPTLEEVAVMLPQYELHGVLGAGGMGSVYLARQAALDRWVAIKLLPASASQNEEDAQRFITEARSMARLTHAHIAAVYDFGQTSDGHLYLVMEYVHGLNLHQIIHGGGLAEEQIRAIISQLCDALAYAHGSHIIHRDIKPANILVTEDAQAKIIDFGLAHDKAAGQATDAEYGTPDYVAPERLRPGAVVDHRADIYSLGVVIHEMFTGLTPQAAGENAGKSMPREYAVVVTRCTAMDPALRFQKCGEIKAYLGTAMSAAVTPSPPPPAFVAAPPPSVAGVPVNRPLPPHLQARVRKPSSAPVYKSNGVPGWVWAAACAVLAGGLGFFVHSQRSQNAPVVETAPASASQDSTAKAMDKVPAPAPAVPANAPPGPFKPTPGDFALLKRLKGHTELVQASALLPDQRHAISGGHDDTLRVWDVATGMEVKSFPSPVGDIHGLQVAADGKRVLVYSFRSDKAAIFDLKEGTTVASIKAPTDRLTLAAWASDQKGVYLLCNDAEGGVYHWDPARGAVLQQFSDWPRAAYHIFPLPEKTADGRGQVLVMGCTMKPNPNPVPGTNQPLAVDKPSAALFSVPDHRLIRELPDYTNFRNRLSLSPDGSTIVGGLGVLYLLDVPALTTRSTFKPLGRDMVCSCSTWAADGRLLVCGYADGSIVIRDAVLGEDVGNLKIGLRATAISLSKDEGWMVVSGHPLDMNAPKVEDFEMQVIRLPDLGRLGAYKGFLAVAIRQLSQLDTVDPELAAIRALAFTPNSLINARQMSNQVKLIAEKYGNALKRAAATASGPTQAAMHAEADAIAQGQQVPEAVTDAATTGEHNRLRSIYREQISQLEARRIQAALGVRRQFEPALKNLSTKRNQSGDRLGSARCEALIGMLAELVPVGTVIPAQTTVAASNATRPNTPPAPPPAEASIPRAPPMIPSSASAEGVKLAFANEVKIEVAIGRPSKVKGGDFDDKMQVIEPHVKMTNTSLKQGYEGYKACFLLIGESAVDSKVIQILQRQEFPVSIPARLFLEKDLPSVTTQYDTTGAKFGFKYEGWLVQITGPGGEVIHTKSTSPSLEKLPELISQLKEGTCYDRKLKMVEEPSLF